MILFVPKDCERQRARRRAKLNHPQLGLKHRVLRMAPHTLPIHIVSPFLVTGETKHPPFVGDEVVASPRDHGRSYAVSRSMLAKTGTNAN